MGARRRRRRQLAAIAADLPDVVDLLVLAVGAGLTVRLAVAAVARRSPGPLGAELARALQEADLGRRLADALDDLPERAGEATRPTRVSPGSCDCACTGSGVSRCCALCGVDATTDGPCGIPDCGMYVADCPGTYEATIGSK